MSTTREQVVRGLAEKWRREDVAGVEVPHSIRAGEAIDAAHASALDGLTPRPQEWIAALIESELGDTLAAASAGDPHVDAGLRARAEACAEYIVNRILSVVPA